jgi:SAM-dependent methyltransferase
MFQFNFDQKQDHHSTSSTTSIKNSSSLVNSSPETISSLGSPSRRLYPPAVTPNYISGLEIRIGEGRVIELRKAEVEDDPRYNGSDLVPSVYEGGLKVWECSVDLVRYLFLKNEEGPLCAGKRVIELGCGHGLPGTVALQLGAERVAFADFNSHVLLDATSVTVRANVDADIADRASYYSGDWDKLLDPEAGPLRGEKFDLILTAETVYTEALALKLAVTLFNLLAPRGSALVAAKRYYFGTGGGCDCFRQAASSTGMECEVVQVTNTGASNIREVLRVFFPDPELSSAAALS